MKDIARELKLDPSTVSLALKDDPRLHKTTRDRVRACAGALGYVPDPMLSALSHYRHAGASKPATVTLAFLCSMSPEEMKQRHAFMDLWLGARDCAHHLGYRLELFTTDHRGERLRQFDRIFKARGIAGIIYAPLLEETAPPDFDWAHYSTIIIEGQNIHLPLHKISNDQTSITRKAVGELDRKGYRNIGLAVGSREEKSLCYAFSAGYLVEMALRPHLKSAAPFYMAYPNGPYASDFPEWVRANRFDAVLSNWDTTAPALRAAGLRIPEDIAVASLDLFPGEGANAGMRQNTRVVGARALEQLAMLVKYGQRGFLDTPHFTLVPGTWHDGSDVPVRLVRKS